MLSLPIDAIKSKFIESIAAQHLIVEAETGSGKSTKLPVWAATQGRVLVIEPRRIACVALAEFISEQEESKLGDKIGYAIKLEAKYSQGTEVIFVTPGVALRWFSNDKLKEFDVVLVDEFHERRWDIDLLVALLLEEKQHRLVVTSATIEGEKLAEYVGAKRLVAKGRQFQVGITYNAIDSSHLPDRKNIVQNVVAAIKTNYSNTKGDILVFMPGRSEINQCVQALGHLSDIEVVPLHASVSNNDRDRALKPLGRKKIVIATNVAETSLTIPNITLVIDSGLERRTLQRNGRTVLSLKTISKASAIQRSGRAGRVMNGDCIRLYGEHAPLELITPPELLREELSEAMLAAACCGHRLHDLHFLNSPPDKSLRLASDTLHKMDAIDNAGCVTEHGSILYPLPIDVLYADLITRMPTKATKEAMIDLSAALSVPATLYMLPSDENQMSLLAKWEPNNCDAAILLNLIRDNTPDFLQTDISAVNEAKGLARQMRSAFSLPDLQVASRYNRIEFLTAMARLHPELVYVRRQKRRQALGNGVVEMVPARNSRFSESAEAAIILNQHSLPGRGVKQTLNLATVMLPVPLHLIEELNLGEWQQGDTIIKEGCIYSQLTLIYAGRAVATSLVKPEGDLILKPIIDAVIRNKVLPGFAKKRSREIELWCLYGQLGLGESLEVFQPTSFETWFTHQLTELEISEIDELKLFNDDDFVFDGIPYWQFDEFAQKYPFNLNLGDLQLTVDYVTSKKLIYIVFESGQRKSDPKRWELPNWKGWRIQYKKSSRIINIK